MHPATPGLPTASPPKAVTCVCAGFIKPAAIRPRKAAKCPEPLCPTRELPPLGRRDPSPGRALPLRRRSYWLIRRSRWALSSFGFYPRLESPCRLSPVPAAPGSFPTLFRESVLGCWTPYPGGTPCARACCWDRNRARLAVGEGLPFPLFRLQDGVTFSPWRTVPEAPLKSWTVGFPEPSSKPWHVFRGPSHSLERFKRRFMYTPATPGLPTASPPQAVICVRPVLSSRAA